MDEYRRHPHAIEILAIVHGRCDLLDALKTLYDHKCQVCTHDFKPRYGVPHADTPFIQAMGQGGSLESRNRLVVCPNHNAIIGATHATFDDVMLAFRYPNGLTERLLLRDHLLG